MADRSLTASSSSGGQGPLHEVPGSSRKAVDPELAATVIRDYLLPLFQEGNKPIHYAKVGPGHGVNERL